MAYRNRPLWIVEIFRDVFLHIFDFRGRSPRTYGGLYGIFMLPLLAALLNELTPLGDIDYRTMGNGDVAKLLLSIPLVSWIVRRLHDFDCSGWRALPILPFLFVPKGTFPDLVETVIVFFIIIALWAIVLIPPTPGANRFGPNPRLADQAQTATAQG
ncbi:DUF805 domain-containing protein [Aurantiacibacter gilvus]|uniref:DUF805 domain-containing protein n=1 Tax=Aurantiacibacter gilvus TaxID=3139141 RepID=A0ABU9IDX9_9SPHN